MVGRPKTTTRHKEDNTFRFDTFTAKLAKINKNFHVNLHDRRRLGGDDDNEDDSTHFYETVVLRTELDLTESYTELVNEIGPHIKTLPQIIHNKDRLLKLLLDQMIDGRAGLSFNSTLELLKSLALDLGDKFCSHMPGFVKSICQVILKSKNPEEIEIGFQCLAQLFVNYRRHVKSTYSTYLKLLMPMWSSSNKTYITVFTAECFSLISLKVWRISPDHFFDNVRNKIVKPYPDARHGVASLLASMLKKATSVNESGKFIADCTNLFKVPIEDQGIWRETMCLLVNELKDYFRERNDIFNLFCVSVEERLTTSGDDSLKYACIDYLLLYKFILTENLDDFTVESRCAKLVSMLGQDYFIRNSEGMEWTTEEPHPQSIVSEIVCSFIAKSPENPSTKLHQLLFEFIKTAGCGPPLLLEIFKTIIRKNWSPDLYLIKLVEQYKSKMNTSEFDNCFISFASDAVASMSTKDKSMLTINQSFGPYSRPQYFKVGNTSIDQFSIRNLDTSLYDPYQMLLNICQLPKGIEDIISSDEFILRTLVTIRSVNFDYLPPDCVECCNVINSMVTKYLSTEPDSNPKLRAIIYYALETLVQCDGNISTDYFQWIVHDITYSFLRTPTDDRISLWALKSLDNLLASNNYIEKKNGLNEEEFPELSQVLFNSLTDNLRCGFKIVRGLCLSILWRLEGLNSRFNSERKSALELCLKIEGMSIRDLKFITAANEHFDKLKGLATKESSMPVIVNFVLGYMFTNFQPVWSKCIEILKVCFSTDVNIAWKESSHAFQYINSFTDDINIPKEFDQFDEEGFFGKLTRKNFSLCSEPDKMVGEGYEKLDVMRYRANVWTVLEGVDERCSPDILPCAGNLITRILQKSPFCGLDRTDETKQARECLLPVLNYLAKSSKVVEDKNRDVWFHRLKDLLVSPLETRVLVFKILCRLKPSVINPYVDTLDSAIRNPSLIELRELQIDATPPGVKSEHKKFILDIISRIILEKSQSKGRLKDQKIRGNRDELLRTIAICGHSAVSAFIELALQVDFLNQCFKDEATALKVFEGRIALINSMLTVWHYQYIDVPGQLLLRLCSMASRIHQFVSEDSVNLNKRTISMARECLLSYFKLFSKIELSEEIVAMVLNTFVWAGVDDMMKSSVTNVTWVLKLFAEWSRTLRFHILFTKVRETGAEAGRTVSSFMFQILSLDTTEVKVKLHVLKIMFNLISGEDSNLMEVEEEPNLSIATENSHEVGQSIIRSGKKEIIQALKDGKLFKELCLTGQDSDFHLELLPSLTHFLDDPELLTTLIGVVVGSLKVCRLDDDKLTECFKTLKAALSGLNEENQRPMIKRMATMFSWVKGLEPRRALYEIFLAWKDVVYQPIFIQINAWVINAFDTSDYTTRYEAFKKCDIQIELEECVDYLFFELVTLSCFYSFEMNTQIGEVRKCAEILHKMASRLAVELKSDDLEKISPARDFIMDVILPQFRLGIRNDKAFHNVLGVLIVFIKELNEHHGTFTELKFLVDQEILDMLMELQIQKRTLGMNKLASCLEAMKNGNRMSPANLESFIQPLAYHNLLKESQASDAVNLNELVDSSMEVLKGVLSLYPYQLYLKVISNTLGWKTSSYKIMKQLERILIVALNSFHFDVSAAEKKKIPPETEDGQDGEEDSDDHEVPVPIPINPHYEILTKEAGEKLLQQLTQTVIPQLTNCLKDSRIKGHKLSGENSTVIQEGVSKKTAFGSALANLITKLPKNCVKDIWNTLIPNLCSSIRSKKQDVRNAARKTLVESLKEMGMSYFPLTFKHLKASLQRGYEKHVLHYTVARIIEQCGEDFKKFPTSIPITGILELCSEELFGYMREEKTVTQIVTKTLEAKMDNARPMIRFCAGFAQDTQTLTHMLGIPLQRFSQTTENVKATRSWFLEMSTGIKSNPYIPRNDYLIWLGNQLETYSSTAEKEEVAITPFPKKKAVNALIIKGLESKRVGNNKGFSNILVSEYVFQCLHDVLKESEINSTLSKAFLNYLVDGLSGKSRKIKLLSLRCITCLIGYGSFDFDRDQEILNSIWRQTFLTMSTASLSDSNDHEMVNAIFKSLTTFLGTFTTFNILEKDFELLLKSLTFFLTEGNCSSGAICLLKGITRMKLVSPEFDSLMDYVKELSITSHQEHILEGCRGIYTDYLLNYSMKPALVTEKLQYYLRQFRYEEAMGRRSALIMLNTLLMKVPENVRKDFMMPYFAGLIVAFSYESEPVNKRQVEMCMSSVFTSDNESFNICLDALLKLFKDQQLAPCRSVFATVGGWIVKAGWKHLSRVKLSKLMNFYTEIILTEFQKESSDSVVMQTLIAITNILKVVLQESGKWNPEGSLESMMVDVFKHLREYGLYHDHLWVISRTLLLHTIVFNHLDLSKLSMDLNKSDQNDSSVSYCSLVSTYSELQKIIDDHIALFKSDKDISKLIDSATKNLHSFMRLSVQSSSYDEGKKVLNFFVLCLAKLISHEVTKNPGSTTQRTVAYDVLDTFVSEASEDILQNSAKRLLRPCVRDSTDSNTPAAIKTKADALTEKLKKRIGVKLYDEVYVEVIQKLQDRREQNRATKRENVVLVGPKKRKHPTASSKESKHVKAKNRNKKSKRT